MYTSASESYKVINHASQSSVEVFERQEGEGRGCVPLALVRVALPEDYGGRAEALAQRQAGPMIFQAPRNA